MSLNAYTVEGTGDYAVYMAIVAANSEGEALDFCIKENNKKGPRFSFLLKDVKLLPDVVHIGSSNEVRILYDFAYVE